MAKNPPNRGQEGQSSAPPPAPPAEKAEAPSLPLHRVALCLEECVVSLGLGTNQIFGGEWITDQMHVGLVAHDPHFKVVEGTRAETDAAIAQHAAAVKKLTVDAKALGMTVSRHGSMTVARRR